MAGNQQRDALRNFLSLYAVTQTPSLNGTLLSLPLKNAPATWLFGSGAQNGQQLIQNVWIGGTGTANPYKGINNVLDKLRFVKAYGLHHDKFARHQSHFHVDLRAPVRVGLPEDLLADSATSDQALPVVNEALIAYAQGLLDQVKLDMNLSQGEVLMFIADVPNIPPQDVPVMIAQANQAQAGDVKTMRTIGVCHPAPNEDYSLENVVSPIVEAGSYLGNFKWAICLSSQERLCWQGQRHRAGRNRWRKGQGSLFLPGVGGRSRQYWIGRVMR